MRQLWWVAGTVYKALGGFQRTPDTDALFPCRTTPYTFVYLVMECIL
jgi:hypothetical protein